MSNCPHPFFTLMNCDLVAVALPGDAAQGALFQALYAGRLAACSSADGLRSDQFGVRLLEPCADFVGDSPAALAI